MGSITVSKLGKRYHQYVQRWGRLADWLIPFYQAPRNEKWVLRDVSFNIAAGEKVAIVGLNGAGKSTLLKLISRTQSPTEGSVQIGGSIAAILELGMGFHPEFTGRQNIYLTGQLLGLNIAQIEELIPEIVAFAELEAAIDEPLRVYSSGMQIRLAFSIATATRPDILIIDEALSVGDAAFQQKSFKRIQSYCEQGSTLILVSHDQNTIHALCDRTILLSKGAVAFDGEPAKALDLYALQTTGGGVSHSAFDSTHSLLASSPNSLGQILKVGLYDANTKKLLSIVPVAKTVCLNAQILLRAANSPLHFAYQIKNRFGQPILYSHLALLEKSQGANQAMIEKKLAQNEPLNIAIEFDAKLGVGQYSLSVALVNETHQLSDKSHWQDLNYCFEVVNTDFPHFEGKAWLEPSVAIH